MAKILLRPLYHEGSNRLIESLGKWTTTIHPSKRLWPFYYSSENNMLYQGYREHCHDNTKFQFDGSECYDGDVFYFVPKEQNIAIECIPNNKIPVNITVTPWGWRLCHYQTLQQSPPAPAPITDLIQYIKSQPAYISQYYAHIKCEIPEAEIYQAMKATKKIMMATDERAKYPKAH